MDIESLINPIFLMGTNWERRTRKIVANAIEARDAMDKNGRDSMLLSLSQLSIELIKAVLTIRKHINGSNDSRLWKIDAILGSFTWQLCFEKTQRMENSTITDFFES